MNENSINNNNNIILNKNIDVSEDVNIDKKLENNISSPSDILIRSRSSQFSRYGIVYNINSDSSESEDNNLDSDNLDSDNFHSDNFHSDNLESNENNELYKNDFNLDLNNLADNDNKNEIYKLESNNSSNLYEINQEYISIKLPLGKYKILCENNYIDDILVNDNQIYFENSKFEYIWDGVKYSHNKDTKDNLIICESHHSDIYFIKDIYCINNCIFDITAHRYSDSEPKKKSRCLSFLHFFKSSTNLHKKKIK